MWLKMSLKKKRAKRTLLDDASPTSSSVQINAVTAMLASDQQQQPNPVVPYPSGVQVHSSTRYFTCQHTCRRSFSATTCQCGPPAATGANLRHPKLRRLEEQQRYPEELAMIREPKVMCSLDL